MEAPAVESLWFSYRASNHLHSIIFIQPELTMRFVKLKCQQRFSGEQQSPNLFVPSELQLSHLFLKNVSYCVSLECTRSPVTSLSGLTTCYCACKLDCTPFIPLSQHAPQWYFAFSFWVWVSRNKQRACKLGFWQLFFTLGSSAVANFADFINTTVTYEAHRKHVWSTDEAQMKYTWSTDEAHM